MDYSNVQRINDAILHPIAVEDENPDAFGNGWRLMGIDGTRFALQNTEAIAQRVPNAKAGKSPPQAPCGSQREQAEVCFPQINACALVELGTHAPVAAEIGINREGELTLAYRLIGRLRKGMFLLGDQLYGCGAFLQPLHLHCREVGAAFVLKMLPNQTSRIVEILSDGSAIVEVDIPGRKRPADIVETIRVRQITHTVSTVDEEGRPLEKQYRLWTNLLDVQKYPARDVAEMAGFRWEHEIYYKEAKSLMPHEYLESQLLETAVIEIMSLLWVTALLAQTRNETACRLSEEAGGTIGISFFKTHQAVENLFWLLQAGRDILDPNQMRAMVEKVFDGLKARPLPPPRNRKCPSKIRRQQRHWPKLRKRVEWSADTTISIRPQTSPK